MNYIIIVYQDKSLMTFILSLVEMFPSMYVPLQYTGMQEDLKCHCVNDDITYYEWIQMQH